MSNNVAEAIATIEALSLRVGGLDVAARLYVREHPATADDVMDTIGNYPSSEPALRALQHAWYASVR